MNSLRQALEEYLAIRHALGYKLRLPASQLRNFVTFMEGSAAEYITTALALEWAKLPADVQPATWADRLAIVRRFATWQSAADPRTEVPPEQLLPHRYCRKPPYIYSDEEIEALVQAAAALPSSRGLRGATYSTVFGLLAVTGMRINEAVQLDRDDVDLEHGMLTIQRTKFGKSRLVPLHASSIKALITYAQKRDAVIKAVTTKAFFLSERNRRITEWSTRYNFARVSAKVGLRPVAPGFRHGKGPRIHDMRHRFAVTTLLDFYRAGIDVERELPKLSTYLGHVHVYETYWYLEAVPELLELATERLMFTDREERS